MKIEINGIIIERLKEKDIELVRQWRNSNAIRKNMLYQEIITPEQQLAWFHSINNFNNFYFILEFKGRKVGLVNIKDIDWEEGTGESGIFMSEKDLFALLIPVAGIVAVNELVGNIFGLKKIYARVRKDNKAMQKLNSLFGYKKVIESGTDNKEYDLYYITPNSFNKNLRKWIKLINSMGLNAGKLKIIMEPEDYQNDFGVKMEKLIGKSDVNFAAEIVGDNKVYNKINN